MSSLFFPITTAPRYEILSSDSRRRIFLFSVTTVMLLSDG